MSELLTLLIVVGLTAFMTDNIIKNEPTYKLGQRANGMIQECETRLERNKKCGITAIRAGNPRLVKLNSKETNNKRGHNE